MQHSWGEFYETAKACDGYSEEERKKFIVFETLDKATTFEEIKNIISTLASDEINWLNSSCLDGIVSAIMAPEKFIEKEYTETWKFFLNKKLIKPCVSDICAKNYANIISLLLEKLDNSELNIVLVWASENGHFEIIKSLLDLGADIHFNDDKALRFAVPKGCIDIVKLLLDRGANIHTNRDLPLIQASRNGYTEIIQLLLDRGADIHVKDDEALRSVSGRGHTETVKLLLDRGADIHAGSDEALRWASYDDHTETVKLLLDRGADIHAVDDWALREASMRGHVDTVKLLLDRGANIHAENDNSLYWASVRGYTEIVKLLLDRGAMINDNRILREIFCDQNRIEITKLLKDKISEKKFLNAINNLFSFI